MANNYLEELIAEWYQYQGYFVRRNVMVGLRPEGGYECELDIIAFDTAQKRLIQIEPSSDAVSWIKRESRYQKKFDAGNKYIPNMFKGLDLPTKIEQVALFTTRSKQNRDTIAGGKVVLISELLQEIFTNIPGSTERKAIPEQFPILRTLQLVKRHQIGRDGSRLPRRAG
ncbi:MAG: hypothetical protein Q8O16_06680 [Dehalococcoidia bacterium]|nr:hypothetical protein [Dehalococcoidia bacterium]